jgi:alanyl aminopeptidase
VSEVWLTMADSSRVEATYKQQLESGVAQISFAKTVSAGNASLHFNYSAAFNTSVNALFKVTRGEESYVASQFEPTGARQSFTGLPMTKPAHNDGLPLSVKSAKAPCTRVV